MSTTSSEIRALRERPPNAFERFAEASARFVSKGTFFTGSVLVVAIWIPTIALFDDVDTWQLEDEDPERLRRHVDGLRDSIQLERRR